MKLLSAHVVAFGMLKDKEYLFKEGLNCFEAPNGRGKTTLLSFVKAVLFGMEGSSAKSRFVERDRYEPSSSEYGGSVTLEHQGTEYRIERFFMKKRETTDEVRVFRNGVLVNADEVGTFFFGVDRASFERTLYMTATDVEVACTDGIRAKIGNYTEDKNARPYAEILKTLDEKIHFYKKPRARSGAIDLLDEEMQTLRAEISNAERMLAPLPSLYKQKVEEEERAESLEEEIRRVEENNLRAEKFKTLSNYLGECDALALEIRQAEALFPKGEPRVEQTQEVLSAVEEGKRASAAKKAIEENCQNKIDILSHYFSNGIPSEEWEDEISALFEEQAALRRAEKEGERALSQKPSAFEKGVPQEESVKEMRALFGEDRQDASTADKREQKPYRAGEILWTAGTLGVLIACLSSFFFSLTAGVILGAVFLLSACFLLVYLRNRKGAWGKGKAAEKAAECARAKVMAFLAEYGYEGEVFGAWLRFEQDLAAHKEYLQKAEELKKAGDARKERLKDISRLLVAFFEPFDVFEPSFTALTEILACKKEYLRWIQERDEGFPSAREYALKTTESEEIVRAFYTAYGLPSTLSVQEIQARLLRLHALKEGYERKQKAALEYKEQNRLYAEPSVFQDVTALRKEVNELRKSTARLAEEIASREDWATTLEKDKEEYEDKKQLMREYKSDFHLLCETKRCFEQAEGNLRDKYLLPVRKTLAKYADQIGGDTLTHAVLDANLDLKYELQGEWRNAKTLSAGEGAVLSLCYRLALAESVYGERLPFLVLDDPFVHLDEENFAKAAQVVKTLAQKVQILYSVCHPSRFIE